MANRRNEKTISLFPFLAVLVCTMGALILLLLVTTRRIRQKQHETTAQLIVSDPAEYLPDSTTPEAGVPGIGSIARVEAQTRLARTQYRRAELEQAVNSDQKRNNTVLHWLTEHQREVTELQQVLKTVQQKQETTSSGLTAAAHALAELQRQQDSLQRRRNESAGSVGQLSASLRATESLTVAAEQLLGERQSALRTLRDLSDHQQDRAADTGVVPTVIEFSNSAGTSKTPVVVELTDHGFIFPATQIKISQNDMEGTSPADNPLLSGVLAIHHERSKNSLTSRPYVLLLVRPGGTLGFYAAQQVFQEADIHFGYELVCDDQIIAAAPAADGEAEAVQTAVLNSLIRREKYLDAVSSIRPPIAALRGSKAGISRRPQFSSDRFRRESHEQSFEESSGKSPDDSLGHNSSQRHAVQAETETSPFRHPVKPDSKLMDENESQEIADGSAGRSHPRTTPVEIWESIPSMAEAKNQVERELAKALAARETLQRLKTQNGFTSDDSASLETARQTMLNQKPPVTATNNSILPNTNDSNDSAADQMSHNQLRMSMQPKDTQQSLKHFSNKWSSETSSGRNQPDRSLFWEGDGSRPSVESPGIADANGRASAGKSPSTVPFNRLTDGTSGFTNGLISYQQVTIYLDPQNYTIVGHQPVTLVGQEIHQIVRSIAGVLFEISRRNPHPLTEMTMPAATFVVSPGAHVLYLQLAAQLHDLEIPVASIVSMAPHVTDGSHGFIPIKCSPTLSLTQQISDQKELQ